jgi:WD40 repeat protein
LLYTLHVNSEADGAPIWRFATQGAAHTFADAGNDTTSVMASPTFAGDVVAVGARDGYLYALDATTGRERWRTTHDGSSWILGTAYDGRWLYVGSGSAQFVQAADPQTGVERWRFPTRGAVFSSLTLAGGTLLFTDFTGVVYAVETRGGALQWQFPLHGRSLSTPVYAAGLVYCSGDDGALIALAVDDDTVAAAPAADARRIAFWQGPSTAGAFAWFQNGVDVAFLAYLLGAGYERMDRAALVAFMHDAGAQRRRSLVVFVDNRIPDELAEGAAGTAPLRRYLEAGGKVVLLGPNPLAYVTDAGGQVTGIDYSIPQRILDVRYAEPERVAGYYASFPTGAGRAIGLRSPMVGTGAIEPAQGVTVLARDEFGQASAWLKSYGGPRGTGLLQLALPRQEAGDFSELRAAIEDGVAR